MLRSITIIIYSERKTISPIRGLISYVEGSSELLCPHHFSTQSDALDYFNKYIRDEADVFCESLRSTDWYLKLYEILYDVNYMIKRGHSYNQSQSCQYREKLFSKAFKLCMTT